MNQDDPPVINELMEWCFERLPEKAARQRRVPRLFEEFRDLIDDKTPIVTVAGTSGKGTTCALLEAVLAAGGHVTGVYTKPHLFAFRERFRVAGRAVSRDELATHAGAIYERLKAFLARHGPEYRPSLYEVLVLIAASIFARHGVTFAVYEAAVGGASCATSHLPSVLSIVTSVDLDHQAELGSSVEEIARDKAGIARPGGTLVSGAGVSEAAARVVAAECAARGVSCVRAPLAGITTLSTGVEGQRIGCPQFDRGGVISIPFPGRHQLLNFATVWCATQILYDRRYLRDLGAIRGVARAKVPGRFEFVRGAPAWLLDVAHNPASVRALIDTAGEVVSREAVVGVVGATERHDHRGIVDLLCRWGIPLGFCEGFPRALPAARLGAEAATTCRRLPLFRSPGEAVDYCANTMPLAGSTVLVTGSLFLVGQVRHELARRGRMPVEVD